MNDVDHGQFAILTQFAILRKVNVYNKFDPNLTHYLGDPFCIKIKLLIMM